MGPPRSDSRFHFGTNGWRGIFGEDFTFPRLRAVVRGSAEWIAGQSDRSEVIVAHDTRWLGERMAATAAALLRERGFHVRVSEGPTPTPVVGWAVCRRGAAGAVVFTASHNPPEYQGVKIFGPAGSCLGADAARSIETLAVRASEDPVALEPDARERVDLKSPYLSELLERLDCEALRGADLQVWYDAMHGSGAGVVDRMLERAGARVQVRRAAADPTFGGVAPDPIAPNLVTLRAQVRSGSGPRLGVATDGDADRFAIVDADGAILSETDSVALLVDHLARTGRIERGVAISIATGSLVEKVARDHGLKLVRHPIGFSALSQSLEIGECDVAGDESGGFAIGSFSRDKDGAMASALMVELAAMLRAPLRTRLDELKRRHGPGVCGRDALTLRAPMDETLCAWVDAPPDRVDGFAVRRVSVGDGLHLGFDDGFLMLRRSGTEPVVRVYAEAPDDASLRRRLDCGLDLLRGVAA